MNPQSTSSVKVGYRQNIWIKRLRDNSFNTVNERKTHGIEIHPWQLNVNQQTININFLDFVDKKSCTPPINSSFSPNVQHLSPCPQKIAKQDEQTA
jgi:hypothetical protein